MKKILQILAVATIAISLGCGEETTTTIKTKTTNVVRVFMNRPGSYTLGVKKPESAELEMVSVFSDAKLLEDVPPGEAMWAEETIIYRSDGCGTVINSSCVIHIHSEKNVEGGSWNNGKFGSGKNQVIK